MVQNLESDLQKKVVINTLASNVTFRVAFLLFFKCVDCQIDAYVYHIIKNVFAYLKQYQITVMYTSGALNKANIVSRICNGITNTYQNIRTRHSGNLGIDLSFYNITYTMTILISYVSQVSSFETFILSTLKCNKQPESAFKFNSFYLGLTSQYHVFI